jgi:hypothetical protein
MHKKNLYPVAPDFQLKRKKSERRKKKEVSLTGGLGSLTLPDLAVLPLGLAGRGSRRPTVFFCFVFFFFFCFSGRGFATHGFFFLVFPAIGLTAPRCRFAQTPRGDSPCNKSTTGHRDPQLALASCGFGFFLVLG